jgi:hypothetical protein
VVTHNLTQAAAVRRRHGEIARALHPGPCHPNPLLAIFQDRSDPTGDVRLEVVVLPTQKAGVRADPECSVRRTQQRHDRPVEYAIVRSARPALEANAVEPYQSGIGPNPDVAVGRLRDRIGR